VSRQHRLLCIIGVTLYVAGDLLQPVEGSSLPAATADVRIVDFTYEPKMIFVDAGDAVRWQNDGQTAHTVSADDDSFDSGNLDPTQVFTQTFATVGLFPYYCKYHGEKGGIGMSGTVVVQGRVKTYLPLVGGSATGAVDSIAADDQPILNGGLLVKSVIAAQRGWVVAHLDEDGHPGRVLGYMAVPAGMTRTIFVELNNRAQAGSQIWLMLHLDTGATDKFEFPGPDAPVIVNGELVMTRITILASALRSS
jgi:plastocyanin